MEIAANLTVCKSRKLFGAVLALGIMSLLMFTSAQAQQPGESGKGAKMSRSQAQQTIQKILLDKTFPVDADSGLADFKYTKVEMSGCKLTVNELYSFRNSTDKRYVKFTLDFANSIFIERGKAGSLWVALVSFTSPYKAQSSPNSNFKPSEEKEQTEAYFLLPNEADWKEVIDATQAVIESCSTFK